MTSNHPTYGTAVVKAKEGVGGTVEIEMSQEVVGVGGLNPIVEREEMFIDCTMTKGLPD